MVPWIRPLANSHLASKSHPDGLNKWDEKGNGRFDQKKKKKEKGGGRVSSNSWEGIPRESQPVFQACCHADTSLPGTVTFGVVPLLCISTVSWIASTVLWNLLDSILSRLLCLVFCCKRIKGVCAVYLWIIVVIWSIFLLVRDGNKEVKTDNELFILPFIVSESKDCHAVAVSNIFHDFELMWTPWIFLK